MSIRVRVIQFVGLSPFFVPSSLVVACCQVVSPSALLSSTSIVNYSVTCASGFGSLYDVEHRNWIAFVIVVVLK